MILVLINGVRSPGEYSGLSGLVGCMMVGIEVEGADSSTDGLGVSFMTGSVFTTGKGV